VQWVTRFFPGSGAAGEWRWIPIPI